MFPAFFTTRIMTRLNIHPSVRIVSLLLLAVTAQWLHWRGLVLLLMLLLGCLAWVGWKDFVRLFRRAKWLLVSLLLIYAFATPGEFISGLPEWLSPTYEGLSSGATQSLRLVVMLAALACLLATGSREVWMSGIYGLLRPLRFCGISAERFAVRLWLTLHYVENAPAGMLKTLREQHWNLEALMQASEQGPAQVQLSRQPIRLLDWLVLLAWVPAIWWMV